MTTIDPENPNVLNERPERRVTWTTVNAGEAAFPGVPTPLSWSWSWWPTEHGVRGSFAELGALSRAQAQPPGPIADRALVIQRGHVSLNLDLFRSVAESMPGTSGNDLERSFFGSVREGVQSQPNLWRYPIVAIRMPVAAAKAYRAIRAFVEPTDEWWRGVIARDGVNVDTARGLLREAQRRYAEIATPHTVVGLIAQALYDQVTKLCERAEIGTAAAVLVPGGADEAAWITELFDIAQGRGSLDGFLDRHGYHGPLEGELSSPSWRMQPAPLERLCELYRAGDREPPRDLFERRRREGSQAYVTLLDALPRSQRALARSVVSLARAYMPLRETGRATFLRAYDVARLAARVIGTELADSGAIDTPSDVFYLTFDEVVRPSPPVNSSELIAARKELRARYEEFELPNLWEGDLPENLGRADSVADTPPNAVLTGQAVSNGIAEGTVRVVLHPDDDADFEPGDILVCRATDPSWAPLFYLAAAVVIDIGGEMSHAAIIARELGLPAVVNTRDGTRRLVHGSRVRVDGGTGVVTRLDS